MKNVVFDLGGVVLDWNPKKARREFRGNRELAEFLFTSDFFRRNWTEFDRGMVTENEIIHQMSQASGCSAADCREFVEYVKYSLKDIPQTVELIRQLSVRGYDLYCLSNMSVEFYDYLKGRAFFRFFKGQIISGLVHLVKPEEAIFRLLLEKYSLRPEETLFIDDLESNTRVAGLLGFHTVIFDDREKGYEEIGRQLGIKIPVGEVCGRE